MRCHHAHLTVLPYLPCEFATSLLSLHAQAQAWCALAQPRFGGRARADGDGGAAAADAATVVVPSRGTAGTDGLGGADGAAALLAATNAEAHAGVGMVGSSLEAGDGHAQVSTSITSGHS